MQYEEKFLRSWRQPPTTSPRTSPSPPATRPTTPSSPSSSSSKASGSRSSSRTSFSSSNWRNGSPPRPISNQAGRPSFEKVENGDILYLPPTPIPSSSLIRQHPNQSNFENHPLVILGKRKEAGVEIVAFRQLTTFGGKTLERRKEVYHQHFYMMVENHQDMATESINPVARMASGFEPLQKRSYVNLSPNSLFEIEYKYLEAFTTHGLRRLDAKTVSFIQGQPCTA